MHHCLRLGLRRALEQVRWSRGDVRTSRRSDLERPLFLDLQSKISATLA